MTTERTNTTYVVPAVIGGTLPPRPTAWQQVETVLLQHYFQPDLEAARALYAAIAAHRLTGQPVWPMLVGPPGSMKTELLNGMSPLDSVHFVDQITAQTFISGHIVEKGDDMVPAGLLGRIGTSGVIVYPDFSTILAMKAEAKASILADMRRIYDGHIRKEFGTANNLKAREWRGRITFAVAATPAVDSHYGIFQSLGERFVMIRWGRPDGIEAALTAMNQDSATARKELQEAVQRLFRGLPIFDPVLSETFQRSIAALADFVTRARTHVERSGYTKEMLYEPEPEAPTRLGQQLAQLAKGSALLDSRPDVGEQDYAIVKRVAFDCIPTKRRRLIEAVCEGWIPEGARSTLSYCVEDLQVLHLLEERQLSKLSLELLTLAGIIGEFTRSPSVSTMVQ
jgi:hypothetical protein